MKFLLLLFHFHAALAAESGYAPVNGLKMYYEIHGQGEPLVLIHGGGSTIESNFGRLIPLLAKARKVIAMEEQGHGHTAAMERPFTFENSASDVAALLDYLKIKKADIFGFSNGGNIAMRLAQRYPEKVDRLVVASSMYRRDGMQKGFWAGMQKATLKNMPKELQEADKKINPDPQHLIQLFKQDSQRMKNFKDWPDREIKAITAPTLVMVGDRDVVTVEHALKISRLVQNGRLAVLPSGHGDYLEEAATTEGSGKLLSASAILILNFLGPAK